LSASQQDFSATTTTTANNRQQQQPPTTTTTTTTTTTANNNNRQQQQQQQQHLFLSVLSPAPSGVIDTQHVDDRIRIGKGGTLGTQFVVLCVHETHTEATNEWKWLLGSTESTCITGILSAARWRLLKGRLSRRVSITSTILLVVALSLG
jgi:hypothetical protein